MLDPHTFGGSHAAEILVEKLDRLGDPKLTGRVCSLLSNTLAGFAHLASVQDDRWFERLVLAWRKTQLAKVDFGSGLDSYVENLVLAASRDWINGSRGDPE